MKSPENFNPEGLSVEEKERRDAGRVKPLGEETFERVADELEKKAKAAGLEGVGQLPPESFPPKGDEDEEDLAA